MTQSETVRSLPSSSKNADLMRPTLSLTDAIAIIVGIVIGAGIFETPALVAANSDRAMVVLLVWALVNDEMNQAGIGTS